MCADIVDAFKASLEKLEWMDKKSAVAAAEKVSITDLKYFRMLTFSVLGHRPTLFGSKSDSLCRQTLIRRAQ
jgi:hypothetical protein